MMKYIATFGAIALAAVGGWLALGVMNAPRVLAIPTPPSAINTITFAPEGGKPFNYTLQSLEVGKPLSPKCTCQETLAAGPARFYLSARNEATQSDVLLSQIALDETPRKIVFKAEIWVDGEGSYHAPDDALMGEVSVKASKETILYAQNRIVRSLKEHEKAGELDIVIDALICDPTDKSAGRLEARLSGIFIPRDEQRESPGAQDASIAVPFSLRLDQPVRFDNQKSCG